jgi:serine/threonine-protein phosphatase 5
MQLCSTGGCEVDSSYTGPRLEKVQNGGYKITQDFVDSMLDWFKGGKALHRRFVWEIVLGCYSELFKEDSLTDLLLEQGVTCDVIGDLHGNIWVVQQMFAHTDVRNQGNTMICYIYYL